jgi:transcriptional regulator with XRE-family HTH domain
MTTLELIARLECRRHAIRMTKAQLSVRASIPIATLNRILSGQEKRPSFDRISALARALGVVVHVGATVEVEETDSAFTLREKQARQKAQRVARIVQGNMGLEAQAVESGELAEMVDQATVDLLAGSKRKLWSK